MSEQKFDFGMIGLGVMGRNFALNVADNGFSVIGLDTDAGKADALATEADSSSVRGTTSTEEFVASLASPRRIMMLVPAGKVVDIVIDSLIPHLDKGDLIIDGGNSYFEDTDRRVAMLNEKGINYLGVGVSGGAEGARRGPSIMPGGNQEAYETVRPILEAVSAKVNTEPCVDFMGHASAGNYVKMVHNGIEYAMMQLLAESYDVLKRIGGLSNQQLHSAYTQWNEAELKSYLVEITAEIFDQSDDLAGGELIDKILDKAKQKGTGKWTSQHAMDLGVPVPTIDAAVTMRGISSFKTQRATADSLYDLPNRIDGDNHPDPEQLIEQTRQALLFGFIMSYSQGMTLLAEASVEKGYEIDLERCARIWRGGCIIRADLLEDIRQAYSKQPNLFSLIVSPVFTEGLSQTQAAARSIASKAMLAGVPVLTLSSAVNYFDAFTTERLPLNLVQAQRDYFGSHTYERLDRDGTFHTAWNSTKTMAN